MYHLRSGLFPLWNIAPTLPDRRYKCSLWPAVLQNYHAETAPQKCTWSGFPPLIHRCRQPISAQRTGAFCKCGYPWDRLVRDPQSHRHDQASWDQCAEKISLMHRNSDRNKKADWNPAPIIRPERIALPGFTPKHRPRKTTVSGRSDEAPYCWWHLLPSPVNSPCSNLPDHFFNTSSIFASVASSPIPEIKAIPFT